MIARFRRRRQSAVRLQWRPTVADEPLMADIRDAETGELLTRDTRERIVEWLRINGYRPVTGPTGIHVRQ